MHRSTVPYLENKVQELMQQLDTVSEPSGLSSSVVGSGSTATASGEDVDTGGKR